MSVSGSMIPVRGGLGRQATIGFLPRFDSKGRIAGWVEIAAALLVLFLIGISAGRAQAPIYNVRDYGAAGNGVALDTADINRAVDACAKAGRGTVYFPAGTYLPGTVWLKNNVTLWLAAGATLLGTKNLAQYEPPASRGPGAGLEGSGPISDWHDALIVAKGVRNVAIIGNGKIDGNGVTSPNGKERMRGPHGILFLDSQRITVRDVTIQNPGTYSLIFDNSEEVNVGGLTVHGGYDGINMIDVRNATISNCRLFAGDDSLSGNHWDNVTVSSCILNSGCNGMRLGGRTVLLTNTISYGPAEYWSPTSQRYPTEAGFQAGGPVDNLILSNLTMINVGTPIYVDYRPRFSTAGQDLGIGHIIVNNLTVLGAGKTPIYVSAPSDDPAESIILNNVRMTIEEGSDEEQSEAEGYSSFSILQPYAVYARNIKNLELHNVRVGFDKPDLWPALFAENVAVLDLDRFQAERAAEGPVSIQTSGVSRLILDGKEPEPAHARVIAIDLPRDGAVAEEPFEVKVAVENTGGEGLASVPLQFGKQTVSRSVSLEAGEKTDLAFVNLEPSESGDVQVRAGALRKQLRIVLRPRGHEVGPPFQTFSDVPAALKALDKDTFYISADRDDPSVQRYTAMQFGDQYGAIFSKHESPSDGTVVVKVDNPDLRTGWEGLTGIMVRDDITKPGQPGGYVVLGSSPTDGSYVEWAGEGSGLLNEHARIGGYTVWPHWLKLERHGSEFTGFSSTDGAHREQIGSAEVPDTEGGLDVGMFAVRSGAQFEDFKVER